MPEFRGGNAWDIRWVDASGTLALTDQLRKVKIGNSADMIDSTAGSAVVREFLPGVQSWTVSLDGLNNGAASPLGTADWTRLSPRSIGTIIVSPFGTVVTSMRYIGSCIVQKAEPEFPYDDVAVISLEFQGSGALTLSTW